MLYVAVLVVTGLQVVKVGCPAHAFWFGASHETQQPPCTQICPCAHDAPGSPAPEPSWPSVVQAKVADWFGTQPFSVQTSPGVAHVAPLLRGTHAPPTQTCALLPQSFVTWHVLTGVTQTSVVVLQP